MKLLIIDHKARSTRGMPIHQVANASVIVGKDRTVLKDQHGVMRKLTAKELDALRKEAEEVIERGEPLV
jgi:hypothetical protein